MSDGAADSAADARAQLDTVLASLGVLRSRVGSAKTVPMSASVMVNKKDTLAGLDRLAAELPTAMDAARSVLDRADAVIEQARTEAAGILDQARVEAARLVSVEEVHRQASSTAGDLVTSAEQDAGSARSELDDYVDRTLANFEVVLPRTLAEVSAGRRQMVRTGPEHDSTAAARRALGELGGSAAPPTG